MTREKSRDREDDDLQSKSALMHELQVHQIELEMQNRQLRESQHELEEARDRYADLYDYSPVGYLTLDENGVIQDINLTGAGLLGSERENIVGRHFINYLTPSAIPEFRRHLHNTFTLAGNSFTEVTLRQKVKKPRIINMESKIAHGTGRTCRSVISDVTEQRNMGVALQVIRAAQDALLSAIPAQVFYLDENLQYLNVSQTFADFVARKPEEIVHKTFFDLLPNPVAGELQKACSAVLQTGMALYGFESVVPAADGTNMVLSTVLAPYKDLHGKNIGLVGVSFDITTIKSVSDRNSALLTQNRALTRKLFEVQEEERRHISRELHDELGQWFTAIQAESQLILNVSKHFKEIQESARSISDSAKQVHNVIRGMMKKLRPSMLDELGLADSLRELHRQWCLTYPAVICEMKLEIPLEDLGEALNITIYRLVQESLNNISRHANAKKVKVIFAREQDKQDGPETLILKIEDDGRGIDPQQVGEGMGLLGMRERVIAVGGDFYIETTPGKGTILTASFPLLSKLRT